LPDDEVDILRERLLQGRRSFDVIVDQLDVSRQRTQKISTQKAKPTYLAKIDKAKIKIASGALEHPDHIAQAVGKERHLALFAGTYYSTKTTKDLEAYFKIEKRGNWNDKENKQQVFKILARSCSWSALPLLAFLATTMMKNGKIDFIGTISGTLEFEDAAHMKGIDLCVLCTKSDIGKCEEHPHCLYKTKGSLAIRGSLLDDSNIVIDDVVTDVMKAFWDRVEKENVTVIVTGTSGKWDPLCVVEKIKNELSKGLDVVFVNPNAKNTPLYLDAYVPLHKENLVFPVDGEDFLLEVLLNHGIASSEILPEEIM